MCYLNLSHLKAPLLMNTLIHCLLALIIVNTGHSSDYLNDASVSSAQNNLAPSFQVWPFKILKNFTLAYELNTRRKN